MGNNRVRLPTMSKLNVHLTSRTLLMFLSYFNRISMVWYSNTSKSNIILKYVNTNAENEISNYCID